MAVKWGILSTADINKKLLAGAAESDDVDVVAVGSRDLARAEEFAQTWGIERAYGSYEELLADPEVEAVYIPLPNTMHSEWSIKAVEAGKHVLCEKPFSRHIADVERAFDAAEATGMHLSEAFMYRHHPQTARLAELVADGAIGELRVIRTVFSYSLYDADNIRLRTGRRGRLADGRRLLLRQRRPPARRRARVRRRRRAHRLERHGLGLHGPDAVPERRRGALRLRHLARQPRRAGGDRNGGLALPRRPVALQRARDRAAPGRHGRADRGRGRESLPARARGPERGDSRRARAAPRAGRRARPGAGDRRAVPLGRHRGGRHAR